MLSFTAIFVIRLLANVKVLLIRMNYCRSSHKCRCIEASVLSFIMYVC